MQKHVFSSELSGLAAYDATLPKAPKNDITRSIARIHLLGPMRASSYLGADILPRGKKARAILGSLCLAEGTRIPRSRLAAMLWDRVPDFQGRASFRQAFRELMVAFGPLADELIFSNRDNIWLDTSKCWIDVLAILSPETKSAQRSKLVAHCSGELFEELDNASGAFGLWLLGERTRYNERLRKLFEAELRNANGANGANPDAEERAEIARRLIDFDPTHEGASRILMQALAEKGERAQALREYARCREALKSTLEVEPSPETHALYEAIRSFSAREERESAPAPAVPRKRAQKPQPAAARSRLRIGVLPLLATRAPQDDELAFSLSQEIAAALARFRWFDVIAPVALKRRDEGAEEPARPNELDYVVDGALSFSNDKYQISVRLLDLTRYATPVWNDRFELGLDEFHKLDEVVTAPIVARIDPVILLIEGQPKRRDKYGATGLLLLAIPKIYSMEKKKFEDAGRLITQALAIDPEDAMVLAWAAHWHMTGVAQGWTDPASPALQIAEDLCVRAIRIDPENAEAYGIYGHLCSWKRDFDNARHYFDRALRLNPNLPFVWALSAAMHCYVGEADEAIARLDRYRELAPFDPYLSYYETLYGVAYVLKSNFRQAVLIGKRVTKVNPTFTNGYKTLIAALGHLDLVDEAQPYVKKLLELEPNFTVELFGKVYPFKNEIDREIFKTGLRAGGVPER